MKAVIALLVLLGLVCLATQAHGESIIFNFMGMLQGASGGNDGGNDGGDDGGDQNDDHPSCPSYVRILNGWVDGNTPPVATQPLSLEARTVDQTVRINSVGFRQMSEYKEIPSGLVRFSAHRADGTQLQSWRQIYVQPGQFWTFVVTGPYAGPDGMLVSNTSPFMYLEDMQPPNPGKFRGKWYRNSETGAVIDLRVFNPAVPSVDEARIVHLNPKTAIEYPELDAGVHNFNPVLMDTSDPLVNPHTTNLVGGNNVEITNRTIAAGTIFDVYATGASLGVADVASLRLGFAENFPRYEPATGCIVL